MCSKIKMLVIYRTTSLSEKKKILLTVIKKYGRGAKLKIKK